MQAVDYVLLTQGYAKALRSMAAIAHGIHDPDHALEWAINERFIVPTGKPGVDGTAELRLTKKGASAIWLFWKAYEAAATAHRGGTVNLDEWKGPQGEGHAIIE